jgi:hypothetical protein
MFGWLKNYWHDRNYRKRQKEFAKTGTRYYGDGGTVHSSTHLDVETYNGQVVSVWFRCMPLPFEQHEIDTHRANDLTSMYEGINSELHGLEVKV